MTRSAYHSKYNIGKALSFTLRNIASYFISKLERSNDKLSTSYYHFKTAMLGEII
jgi:hypothetical protein